MFGKSDPALMNKLANPPSEKAVLAGICRYGLDIWADIENLLEEATFTTDLNKIIFKCAQRVLSKSQKIDFTSLISASYDLSLSEYIKDKGGESYIAQILETDIHLENVKEHAIKIRRLQFGREIQSSLREAQKNVSLIDGSENLTRIIALAETPVQNLSLKYLKGEDNRPKILGSKVDDYLNHKLNNPCDQVGLSSGFSSYDFAIGGGFRRKGLDVVGSRMKVGKSTFADCVAINLCTDNIPILMVDTEMGEEDHYDRILANISSVNVNDIPTGKFGKNKESLDRVMKAKEIFKNFPYHYVSVAGRKFDEILSIIRRWVLKEVGYSGGRLRDCLVIYDYLKLNTDSDMKNESMQEWQLLGFQTTKLKDLATTYDFPILTFVQLNRDGITKESSDVIGGSDRIGAYCSSFAIFKPKTEEEIVADGIAAGNRKLVPIFTRHGPGNDNGYICLQMDGQYARIKHLGTVKELNNGGYRSNTQTSSEDKRSY